MKERLIDIYFLIILTLYNVICLDVTVMGIRLETFILFVLTAALLVFCAVKVRDWKKILKDASLMDRIAITLLAAYFIQAIFRIGTAAESMDQNILLLTILLMHFVLQSREGTFLDYSFAFSVANMVVYIALFLNAVYGNNISWIGGHLLREEGIVSWLVLSIVTGILAYSTDDRKRGWYALQVLTGSFFLFLQKNFLAIGIVGVAFLLVFLILPSDRKNVSIMGTLLLGYLLLFSNMSLIVNYTKLIKTPVPYSVSVSLYVELALAVLVLIALLCRKRWERQLNYEDIIGGKAKKIIRRVLLILFAAALMILSQMLSGSSGDYPGLWNKILCYIQADFLKRCEFLEVIQESCGIVGILIIFCLVYFVLENVLSKKKTESVQQRSYKVLGAVFLVQYLCLNQSLRVFALYIMIIFLSTAGSKEHRN